MYSLLAELTGEIGAPPALWFRDAAGVQYRFINWPFRSPPELQRVVYAFVNSSHYVGYFGRAEYLPTRLRGHEKRDVAVSAGYTWLYVHLPAIGDPVNYVDAEERLIRFNCPPLNQQHNSLAGLSSYLPRVPL